MIIIVLKEPAAFIFSVEEVKNVDNHLHHNPEDCILGNVQPCVRLDILVLLLGTVRISIKIKRKLKYVTYCRIVIPKQLHFSDGEYQCEHQLKKEFSGNVTNSEIESLVK
jgi:hypothetical protein